MRHDPAVDRNDEWWSIDAEILRCLEGTRLATTTDLARKLGLSEASASSLLALLALSGKARIRVVETTDAVLDDVSVPQHHASRR
jgi:hypothetical protein